MATKKMEKAKKGATKAKAIAQKMNPGMFVILSLFCTYALYNTWGFSLSHWIVSFVKRLHDLGGTFVSPLEDKVCLIGMIVGVSGIAVLLQSLRKKNRIGMVIGLLASVISALAIFFESYSSLKMTPGLFVESSALLLIITTTLGIAVTLLWAGMINYGRLNIGYFTAPFLGAMIATIVIMAKKTFFGDVYWQFVLNTIQFFFILPTLITGSQLAKFSRNIFGLIAGNVGIHEEDQQDMDQDAFASHEDDVVD